MYVEEMFIREIADNFKDQLFIFERYERSIGIDNMMMLAEEGRNLAEDEYYKELKGDK